MSYTKAILKAILPRSVISFLVNFKNTYITRFHTKIYSQEGEDMILQRIYEHKKDGFYVDVGAHHPFRFSNTYLFYKRGWKGINIDAMPGSMVAFDRFRPRDINIQCGVANITGGGNMTYYSFNEPALNGFDANLKEKFINHKDFYLLQEIDVPVKSLKTILDESLPNNQNIDFLSIDVEGLDMDVLLSNDWEKYNPNIILIESWDTEIENIFDNDIYQYLHNKEYVLYAKTMNTLIFKNKEYQI